MPVNNFSVGKDMTFVLTTSKGTLTLSGITDYKVKPMYTDLKHKGLDGVTIHGEIPDGYEVTITLDRQDGNVDNYFAQYEADYFAGVNNVGGSLQETIAEKDGSVSQFRYTNVVLKYDDAGNWKGDANIPISLTAMASRRIKQ